MSYIGQGLPADTFQGFVTDTFAGDGSATTFTLSKEPFSEDTLIVVINNVIQKPTTNFTVSGTTLTIVGTAVASGDVIYAIHMGGPLPIGGAAELDLNGASDKLILDADGDTTISADTDDQINIKVGGTDAFNILGSKLIVGDTASHTDDFLQIESPASGGGHGIQIRRNDTNTDQTVGRVQFGNNTDTDLATISAKTDGANDSGALLFSTQGSGGSSSEAMRIINSNRLLIGHTSVDLASVVSVRSSTDDSLITADNAKSDVAGYMIRSAADRGATLYYAFYDALSGNAADREFYVRGDGNVYADGSFSGSGADYAEFFESKTGNAIAVGTTVVLEDNKVRASTDSDEASSIIGVVRPKSDTMIKASMVIGNCAWNHWSGKYLTDDYDSFITEEFTITEWTETTYEDGNPRTEEVWYETDKIPSDVTAPTEDVKDSDGRVIKTKAVIKTTEADGVNKLIRKKENPSFDKTKNYSPREKRDEWVIIGLLGQVPINKGQKTGDRWIKMRDKSDTVEEWYIR